MKKQTTYTPESVKHFNNVFIALDKSMGSAEPIAHTNYCGDLKNATIGDWNILTDKQKKRWER